MGWEGVERTVMIERAAAERVEWVAVQPLWLQVPMKHAATDYQCPREVSMAAV